MQNIIIKKTVEIPNTPCFIDGQKVRVSDDIADMLVSRGFAEYDQCEEAKTVKAKEEKEKKSKKK